MDKWWSAVSDETKPGPVGVPWYICGNDLLHVITKLCGNTSNKNTVTKDFPCRIGVGIHGEKDCNQRNLCTFDLSVTNDDLWGEQRQMWCVPSTHHLPAEIIMCTARRNRRNPQQPVEWWRKAHCRWTSRECHLQLHLNSLVVWGHRVGDCMVSSIDSALLFDWFGSINRTVRGSFINMRQST